MDYSPTVLDLFCGAGGLALGLFDAGFNVTCAVDNFPAAVATYGANFSHKPLSLDLAQSFSFPAIDVVAGGPPCQGFSSAGLRQMGDARNSLVSHFAQIVVSLKPKAFIFENVEGFLTAEGGIRVLELLEPLVGAGYRIHLRKVNAANYGVPQHRKRVIAIGALGWDPHFPDPTHTAFGAPGAHLASRILPLSPTVMDALEGLPEAQISPPGEVQGHFYRPLSALDLERANALLPGQTMRDLPDRLQHQSYQKRAFRRVKDGMPTDRRGGAPTGVRRLRPDEPSKAITGGALSEFIHPMQNRPLTLRECARLQTFPDSFIFHGNLADQIQLVGNAIPPLFATALGKSLLRDLMNDNHQVDGGALLSFVPTLSSGLSPALRRVQEMVVSSFSKKQQVNWETLPLWP